MPKCWKVGAGTFGPDGGISLHYLHLSGLGALHACSFAYMLGPFLNPVSDPNSPYPTEADGLGT